MADALRAEAGRGFDLTRELPIRVRVLRVGAREHVLSLVVHHVAGDGWSLGPLAADLATAYGARVADGVPPDWSPLPVQYADYTLWQRDLLGDEDDPDSEISRQLDHWTRQLAGLPTEIDLPATAPGPASGSRPTRRWTPGSRSGSTPTCATRWPASRAPTTSASSWS